MQQDNLTNAISSNAFRRKKRSWIKEIVDGYAWANNNICLLLVFLLLYTILVSLIAWHTNQALCSLLTCEHLAGIPYILIGLLGTLTLIHESEHVWKYQWMKVPIGIVSIYFIYYCILDSLWWITETVLKLVEMDSACGTVLCMVVSGMIVAIGFRNTKQLKTSSYDISIGKGYKEFHIALISDLHLGAFVGVDHVKRIVSAINELKSDLVIIAGDLIDDDNSVLADAHELACLSHVLKDIKSKFGTVLTLGNHDPNADDSVFQSFLREAGITLLHNQTMELLGITLVGISDPTHNERIPIGPLLSGCSSENVVIVADHDPRYSDSAVENNADLILSGHTHAGQFFPASLITRISMRKHQFYGHYKTGKTHTIVTSGAGFFNLPVRIGTCNEVVELILRNG